MWWKITAIVFVVLVIVVGLAIIFGKNRWRSHTRDLHGAMEAARVPVASTTYDPQEWRGCPRPFSDIFARS